ncbi:hypothetical protein C1J03_19375 [Sulfitobacter sp. SK012]|nr:hypothetical protein C1J03_19375 [Sulfitobacter sp. SK012]
MNRAFEICGCIYLDTLSEIHTNPSETFSVKQQQHSKISVYFVHPALQSERETSCATLFFLPAISTRFANLWFGFLNVG